MKTDENELTILQGIPVMSKMSGATEKHNLKLRRRNVTDTVNLSKDHDKDLNSASEHIPLVLLSDSTEAWYDGIPRLPDLTDLTTSGKQNGVLGQDSDSIMDNSCDSVEGFTSLERMKISVIRGTITKPDLSLGDFKLLGSNNGGFITDGIRRVLWPKILRLSKEKIVPVDELKIICTKIPNEVYQQILKDVARSGSHISPTATEEETEHFQNQLTQIICWVLHKHPELNYYQGYNDVAATILLVMGLQEGLYVLESISMEFLERFMEKSMDKVNQELFYIFALLERVHPTLLEHLENVELFPHFALAEYTTWYAHKYAENRKLLHRLYDYFLSSPPLMPLYLSSVIVVHRATEIFNTTHDMGHTHKVLCTLPNDLPFETLLINAKNLYRQYPPESIIKDVKDYDSKRRYKEQEWKMKAEASRQERERQRRLKIVKASPRIPYRIRSYKTITVVTILALGLYAFLKSTSGLN
ncbi:hypothetical protein M0802_000717 [Mischocyttarus mexicanus]|nr:hypothetical protein M0802_000717 [Mischocyttarus mexicanus]